METHVVCVRLERHTAQAHSGGDIVPDHSFWKIHGVGNRHDHQA